MASPFRIFRKYQKTLLVIAGLSAMFVFVFADPLSSYLRQSGGGSGGTSRRTPSAVAVSWNGGKLTNSDVGMLVYKRQLVNQFIGQVEFLGRQAVLDAGGELRPLRVDQIGGPETLQQGVENDVVRTRLFADAARAAGMQISNEQVVHYLEEIGRNRVSADQMRAILSRLNVQGRSASIDFVLDAVRDELLARNFFVSYQFSLETVLPEQRWQDWLRVNDRIVVEAAAIPVESYVVDVPEPTEAELTEYFDQFKDREPRPDRVFNTELPSAFPGFRVPRKVDVQYVRADFDRFVDKIEDSVSDEEIQKYYDDNKDTYFIRADSPLTDDTGSAGGDDEQATTTPAEGEQSADEPTEEETPASDLFGYPGEPESSDTSTEQPANEGDATQPAEESTPATDSGSSDDRTLQGNPFRLTAVQAESEPAADATTDGTTTDAASPDTNAATTDAPTTEVSEKKNEPKVVYQPLEEVRDEIRRQIAEQKVNDELTELVGQIESELNAAYAKYFGQVLDAEAAEKPTPEPPAELADLASLAEKHGLEAGKTGPLSAPELRDHAIGMTAKADETSVPLVYVMFGQDIELYQPVQTFDLDGNRFVAMKTSDTPGKVPALADVRDAVVRAWKLQKAADLALKHAEEEAKKAQDAGAWLADHFADDEEIEVVRTDPFAWLTIGSVSPRTGQVDSFRLSEPDGILAAGPEFMIKAFDLDGSEVGAVLNHDRSIAYVLRLVEHQNSQEELRQAFLSEANQWFGLPTMSRAHMQQTAQVLVADLLTSAGLNWERDPDQIIRNEEEVEE